MPQRPKQHHYVTRAYLEGFLEPRCVQLICYGRHRQTPFWRTPQDLATQRNYHSFKRADGTWDDSLELKLQKDVEDPGLEILRLLADGKTRLDWQQRDRLSLLIAVQRFRVPHMRDLMDSHIKDEIRALLSEYKRREQEMGGDPGEMIVGVANGLNPNEKLEMAFTKDDLERLLKKYDEDPQRLSREHFMNLASKFAQIFRVMKWTVYYTAGPSRFITSDCPVAMAFIRTDIDTVAIVRPDCRILFPLSRTSLLFMEHDIALIARLNKIGPTSTRRKLLNRLPEIRIASASTEDVTSFNAIQVEQASRWVFAGQRNDWMVPKLQQASKNVRQVVKTISRNMSVVSAVEGK
jgi:hypothetical protein